MGVEKETGKGNRFERDADWDGEKCNSNRRKQKCKTYGCF